MLRVLVIHFLREFLNLSTRRMRVLRLECGPVVRNPLMDIHICSTAFYALEIARVMEVETSEFRVPNVILRNTMMRIIVIRQPSRERGHPLAPLLRSTVEFADRLIVRHRSNMIPFCSGTRKHHH